MQLRKEVNASRPYKNVSDVMNNLADKQAKDNIFRLHNPEEKAVSKKPVNPVETIILPTKKVHSFIKGKEMKMLNYFALPKELGYNVLVDSKIQSGYYSTVKKTIHLPSIEAVKEFFTFKGYKHVSIDMIDKYHERIILKAILCIVATRFNGPQVLIRYPKYLGKMGSMAAWFSGNLPVRRDDLNLDPNIQKLLMS